MNQELTLAQNNDGKPKKRKRRVTADGRKGPKGEELPTRAEQHAKTYIQDRPQPESPVITTKATPITTTRWSKEANKHTSTITTLGVCSNIPARNAYTK